jgi:hypothetical protein
MESFLLAIINEWHIFAQTKLCTIFRNLFILYHKKSDLSHKELSDQYGLFSNTVNAFLYNDLKCAKAGTKVVYLHKCNVYKKDFEVFIEGLEDKEYTYEEAYHKLQKLHDIHSVDANMKPPTDSIVKENKMGSNLVKKVINYGIGNFEADPDGCVIYHSEPNLR